ncbi:MULTISPECIES: hypothetical protein [unclassified Dietzia]|uniref:hypothetical protein n=1 Tax=unclassified Dietzia TaxID=2617939 RepID=UPI000D21516C|nr:MULTISPECIES: hypothetical protein [unclassified Dietzia]AVZ40332.1 hypothetical protein CT688_13490 [Dietzia sp. JS16-p6b]QGW25812.1 hypothetical protein GJR88_04278 [Dietzia sp. DQ12-45-1b]
MTRPSNTSAIASATGRPWEEWVEMLERAGAREMPHSAIAKATLEMMPESVERAEWWAQGTAIAYEQHAGLRVPGQSCTGDFQMSTSRTISGDMDTALQAWVALAGDREEFGGVGIEAPATTSSSEKWRYWRVPLADGTRVALNFSDKKNGKASVGLTHTKLDSAEAISYWKPVWKDLLAQL